MRLKSIQLRSWLALGFAGALCVALVLDAFFSPDLSRYQDGSVTIVDRQGQILRAFLSDDDKWRLPTTVEDVDPDFVELLKAYEDKRFDHHIGIDPAAVLRASFQALRNGRIVSGASTLTMQTARLLEPGPRTLGQKIKQMVRALQLEARFSKNEILNIYLTLAPYGGNLEGVRAASLSYFGKEPKHLTLAQSALLVALPQSPERLRPDRSAQRASQGRAKVLHRVLSRNVVERYHIDEALAEEVPRDRLRFPFQAPHLAQMLKHKAGRGERVETHIDDNLQALLEGLARYESRWFGDGGTMAALVIDNQSMGVVAHVGSADFWASSGQIDLTRAQRSPGSTLKPFIYAMAFDDLAVHPTTLIEDRPRVFGDYAPRNFDRGFQGTVSLSDALQMSLNVPAVALLDRLGPHRLSGSLKHAGAMLSYARSDARASLPLALGGVGMSLTDLTMLYAGLARDGLVRPISYVSSQQSPQQANRICSETAAWYIREILRGSPMPDGWGQGQGLDRARPIAFKTGTSYGFRDAWSVGYSDHYTVGVWVGRADGSSRPGRYGRNEAAPLLMKIFDLLPPEGEIERDRPINVITAKTVRELPKSMQRFDDPVYLSKRDRRTIRPLTILFPPDGARVALARQDVEDAVALKAKGGRGGLRWIINGRPLDQAKRRSTAFFSPDGEGFARITVVDADGRSATSNVRFMRSN